LEGQNVRDEAKLTALEKAVSQYTQRMALNIREEFLATHAQALDHGAQAWRKAFA